MRISCKTSRETGRGHECNQQKWIRPQNECFQYNTLDSVPVSVHLTQCILSRSKWPVPTTLSPAAIMTQCTHLPFKPAQQHEGDLCVRVCVSHLPFQPDKQHEADLGPRRIMVPPCASEQGDEIDLCGLLLVCAWVCIWPISNNIWPSTHVQLNYCFNCWLFHPFFSL